MLRRASLRRAMLRLGCAPAAAALLWALIALSGGADQEPASAQVPPTVTPPPGVAVERIVPEVSTVSVNDPPFILGVTVEQVNNLGVYEVLLLYDPALLQFNAVANGPFLGSTGRTVFCQPAILTPNFAGTGLTRLAYACNSTGLQPGPSGTGLLAQVQFAPLATGTAVIQLTPSLGDVLGDAIPAISTDGVVTVSPGPTSTPTPTNTPCAGGVCPTNTASPTATAPPVFNCPSPGTALCFEPPDQAIGGVPTSVNVVLAGVNNLGGFEFTVRYEPSVLSFTNITAGPFLGSSGRPVNCVAPQLIPPNKIRLSCVTLGVSPAGASGSGVLATLMFTPIASGASPLSFANATLVAPDASPIAVDESATGTIFVDCGAGCPTLTPTPSPTETPSPTNTLSPTPTFTPLSGGTPCGSCPTPTFTPTIAPNSTIVRVAPTSQSVQELDQFDSFVMIDNVVNLGSFDVQLVYDPTKLQALSIDPGPFLGTGQGQLSCIPTLTAGSARLGCVTLANLDGADGSGQLLKVRFLALAPASATALTLGPVQLTDPSGDSITVHGLQNGTVDVISCGGVCPTFTPTATPGTPTATPTPDGSQTALLFSPGAQTVPLGADFSVDVNVQNVINLGAYQAELEWPPNRFSFVSMQHSSFLGSTGRTVSCQPPIVDVDDIVNPSVVVLRISCNTLGATPPGPSGNALLVRVNLRNTGSGTTAINFSQDSGLSDPAGDDIPSVHLNSALVTTGAPTATHTPLAGGGGFAPAAPPTEDEGRERTSDQPTQAWPNTEHITLAVVGAIIVATAWGRRGIGTALAGAAVGVVIVAAPSMSGGEATASSDAAPPMLAFTLAGDVNDDCRVDVTDEQLMAIRYLAVVGSPLYESRFDVEPAGGDGDIDGRDLQVVLSHDGFDCTTDADGDGCLNAQELGSVPALGGARDPYDEWDFYDVNESRKIDALDIALVRSGYSGSGPVRPEDAIFDRRPGNAPWAPGPPDGRIDAIDIALVRAAYGHSCQ